MKKDILERLDEKVGEKEQLNEIIGIAAAIGAGLVGKALAKTFSGNTKVPMAVYDKVFKDPTHIKKLGDALFKAYQTSPEFALNSIGRFRGGLEKIPDGDFQSEMAELLYIFLTLHNEKASPLFKKGVGTLLRSGNKNIVSGAKEGLQDIKDQMAS